MKKYFNTKEIATAGLLASVMAVIGIIVSSIASAASAKAVLQFSDIIYLSLFPVVKPITLITSACIAGGLIDLFAGGFIYIPFTIGIKILIGITYLLVNKLTNKYLAIIISYLWISLYIFYAHILWGADNPGVVVLEAIVDSIQYSVTAICACITVALVDVKKLNLTKENYIDPNLKV